MIYLVITLIIGINLVPFVLPRLDIWHAQGIFAQGLILLMFSYSFFEKQKYKEPRNKSLAFLHMWVGAHAIYFAYVAQVGGKYDIRHFLPYFNFLCMIMLYKIIVQYLNIKDIKKVIRFMKYAIIATVCMCVLQTFNLAQFFKLLNPLDPWKNNMVVGFIGNGTHLSGMLAMCIPLFFVKKRESVLVLISIFLILLFFTGTTKGDVALSGIIIALCLSLYYSFYTKLDYFFSVLLTILVCALGLFVYNPELFTLAASSNSEQTNLLFDNGRFGLWSYYWKLCQRMFLTGAGLGTVNAIYKQTPFPTARHVHFEYLHFLFELGFISLIAIVYFIKEFIKIKAKDDRLILKCIVIGYLLSGVFNYPMHLWLPSTYAVISYACLIAWNQREVNCDRNSQTNT